MHIDETNNPEVWLRDNCRIVLEDADWQLWATEDGDPVWWYHTAAQSIHGVEVLTPHNTGTDWCNAGSLYSIAEEAPSLDDAAERLDEVTDDLIRETYEAGRMRAENAIHGLDDVGACKAGALIC